ncbi:BadF/BadG/BcrA/BcrD ATPase family protein [Aestuariimicrobium ganziense]|uniref:BadF/BadG/BcrA/BcrD ATPase family protein n=1 Tax=Aestuariimicrobium ganziense TaxID=2773677 RepID=UPI001943D080|nr:BadF/BadG/BcrA/BcrD ATPase family protein [Aestuariimicrobium ganziense]
MSGVVLAVDGGNTKTVAAVVDADGRVLGQGFGGTGDIYGPDGEQSAVVVVSDVIDQALTAAGVQPDDLDHAAFHLAGLDWDSDRELWEAAIGRRWPGLPHTLRNDGCTLLRVASLDGQGLSVVLGTGGALAAAGPAGEHALSFWIQHALGAAGLVDGVFRAAVLAEMGMGPATAASDVLVRVMGYSSVEEALEARTRRGGPWTFSRLAALAPHVIALCGSDEVVDGLVETMASVVAQYATHLVERCGLGTGVPVAVGGGLLSTPNPVHRAVVDHLRATTWQPTVVTHHRPALIGVALDALALAGVALDDGIAARVGEQLDRPAAPSVEVGRTSEGI